MKLLLLMVMFVLFVALAQTQVVTKNDSTAKQLEEVIISVNKWELQMNEVPNKITKISKQEILRNNPQTAADLLAQTGTVFVQKSQLGGGSPMIRGFASNRVLLVVDGVRMNNAIYRSGNLQNVISIDALALETAEVIFGPGSLIYGSDAIGAVMDFHTLQPRLSTTKKMMMRGSASVRYSSANKENTVHTDVNAGWKKWSVLSSITYSKFDDLKMGKNGGQDSYLRPEYVQRINGIDSIVKNSDPRVQRFSGYEQINLLEKIRFRPSQYLDMQYAFTYAKTGDAPRYDRLIQYRNNRLRFAEWNYGPMIWSMHNFQLLHTKKNSLYEEGKITLGYQNYEESRIERTRNALLRNQQTETVKAISFNADANRSIGKGRLFYGVEYVWNNVGSTGRQININTGNSNAFVSRYPDGSIWSTAGIYTSYKMNVRPKISITGGLRYSYNTLHASFDTSFIKFPYTKANIEEGAVTGNAGFVFRATETWQLNANFSTGYRMPNVDDIGKLVESAPGNITVPNPNLRSEYALNYELGAIKHINEKLRVEVNLFHSLLNNAIVRRVSTFNGQDSILFDAVLSRVETLQNVAKATVWGIQLSAEVWINQQFSVQTHANWISGKETDEDRNVLVPLRHAPPFYGSTVIKYRCKKLYAQASAIYNSEISNEKLAPVEQAKTDIYAKDGNGRPYSPGWYTLNIKTSYDLSNNLLLTVGWENISNQRYRSYSSGIVAAGSNLIVSLRASL